MPACAVCTCNSYSRKTKGSAVIYHTFPKDKNVRKKWIVACRRSDYFDISTSRVCSLHFSSEDYQRDLKNELLGLPTKKILNPNAVPSLNLPSSKRKTAAADRRHEPNDQSSTSDVSEDTRETPRAERQLKRDIRKRALEHIRRISDPEVQVKEATEVPEVGAESEQTDEDSLNKCRKLEESTNTLAKNKP